MIKKQYQKGQNVISAPGGLNIDDIDVKSYLSLLQIKKRLILSIIYKRLLYLQFFHI